MSNHRQIRQAHERAVVDDFVRWLNQTTGSNWTVSEHSDPPDAIITDGYTTSWVEHADLYRDWKEARSEMSFVVPVKAHIPHPNQPVYDPDRQIADAFMELLQDKLSKNSYRSVHGRYGQGFLVISERDQLFGNDTIAVISRVTDEKCISGDLGYFGKIYLAFRVSHGMDYAEVTYRNDYD
jgi:hypothetical protein